MLRLDLPHLVASQRFDPVTYVLLQHRAITVDINTGIILAVESVGTVPSTAQSPATPARKLNGQAQVVALADADVVVDDADDELLLKRRVVVPQ